MEKNYVSKEKNFISVVAYLKNNENEVQEFIKNVDILLKEKFEAYEFVLVDDYSTDNTKLKIKEISDDIKGNIAVVDLAYSHGLEIAMLAGVDFAIGDFVFEFDSVVINYKLEEILNIYFKSMQGFDIVAASQNKVLENSSKIFYSYLNKISHRKMELTTETFRIISRRALNRVLRNKEKLRYRKALYHYSGFNTFIYKYDAINNNKVETASNLREKINLASDVLINFSDIGIRVAMNISIIFIMIALGTLIYTIYSYLTITNIQAGWTTMMLFMSFSFSGIFFVLAILAKYMTVAINEIKEKPGYIYKSVDRLSRR